MIRHLTAVAVREEQKHSSVSRIGPGRHAPMGLALIPPGYFVRENL